MMRFPVAVKSMDVDKILLSMVGRMGRPQASICKRCKGGDVVQKHEYEKALLELSLRRKDAPRTLSAMTNHMLHKLLEGHPDTADAIRQFFSRSRTGGTDTGQQQSRRPIRLGTLCSGTDSPAIALKHFGVELAKLIGSKDANEFD